MDPGAPWRELETTEPEAGRQGSRPPGRGVVLASIAAAGALVAGSLALVAFIALGTGGGGVEVVGPGASASAVASVPQVIVQVGGAVAHPGLYSLPAGSRVEDAIRAAGGYSPDVDPRQAELRLNLAAKLSDAQSIVVPRVGESASAAATSAAGGPIDLNTATAEQLDSLPGIGPVTAAKIIAARAEQPFASVDDLVDRKIVSASTLAKLRDLVTVR
jgi:competence protein ComEA